jgi:uncharacterized membrane protein YhaH (DUF805 family)
MNTAANPYAAPRAQVQDLYEGEGQTQSVKLWPPSGRIGRLRYLAYNTVGWLLLAVLGGVAGGLGAALSAPTLMLVGAGLGYAAFVVFGVLLTILRCHDMDWSGWLCLLMIVPLVNLVFLVVPGTKGANRFGAPTPPNTLGVKLLGLALPLVMVLGILAAIALPAYQDYTKRARAVQMK